jgi:hypothetical protein
MVKGFPEKDHYEKDDVERFSQLRGELLKWRMRVLAGDEPLPTLNLEWLRGRDRELFLPLLMVLHGSRFYDILEDFLKKKVEERMLERASSLEAIITKICVELIQGKNEIVFSELWEKLRIAVDGEEIRAPYSLTVRSMNTETFGDISKKDVASILKTKLGMQKRKEKRNGKLEIIYIPNMNKLDRAYKKYLGYSSVFLSEEKGLNMVSNGSNVSNSAGLPHPENLTEMPQKDDFSRFSEGGSLQQLDTLDTLDTRKLQGGI